MADQKISELTAITGANTADDDELVIVDTSASQTKKITLGELENALAERDFSFGDNDKLTFGAGSDLQIYHDGDHSYVSDVGTGHLRLTGTNLLIEDGSGTDYIYCASDVVNLYHAGNLKLNTSSTGISVTGNATFADNGKAIFGAGSDLQIYHSGSQSFVQENGTGQLVLDTQNGARVKLTANNGTENMVVANKDGDVELYYDNEQKLATTSTGVDITGTLTSDGLTVDGTVTGNIASFINDGNSTNAKGIKIQGGTDNGFGENYKIEFFDGDGTASGRISTNTGFINIEGAPLVINEGGSDYDFRVESNDASHMLFVDGGTNRVAIGKASAGSLLSLNDPVNSGGSAKNTISFGTSGWGGPLAADQALDGGVKLALFEGGTQKLQIGMNSNAAMWFSSTGSGTTGFKFYTNNSNTAAPIERFSISQTGTAVFNEAGVDQDFRVESDSKTHMLFVNAGTNKVGIGASSPQTTLEILDSNPKLRLEDSASGSKRLDIGVGSDAVAFVDAPQSAQTLKMSVSGTESFTQYHNANGAVFNEGSADRDFRVESDSYSAALFVDASTSNIGLNNASPTSSVNLSNNKQFVWNNTGIENVATALVGNRTITDFANSFAVAGTTHNTYYPAAFVIDSQYGDHGVSANTTTYNLTAYGVKYNGWNGNMRFNLTTGTTVRNHLFLDRDENVFNDPSHDIDFRVESNGDTHMLFVDAGNDRVLIGDQSTPQSGKLNVFHNQNSGGNGVFYVQSANDKYHYLYSGFDGSGTFFELVNTSQSSNTAKMRWQTRKDDSGTYLTNIMSAEDTTGNVFNDSAGNFDFRVESDGNANMLFVDASGDTVGIGNSSPNSTYVCNIGQGNSTRFYALKIDSQGDTIFSHSRAGTSLMSFRNDSTNYTCIASNNSARLMLGYGGTSDAGAIANHLYFVNGETIVNDASQDRDFRVESDNNSSALFVQGDTSSVMVGKSAASSNTNGFEFNQNGTGRFVCNFGNTNEMLILNQRDGNGTTQVEFRNGDVDRGRIQWTTSGTTYFTSSDRRMKENIADADDAGTIIDAIQVRKFDWIEAGTHQRYGTIAQELIDVFPEAVDNPENDQKMMAVDFSTMVPMLIKEIQSLRARITALENA